VRVITNDPSSVPGDRGYSLWEDGKLLWAGSAPPVEGWWNTDLAAGEAQWPQGPMGRQALITLGNAAGWCCAQLPAARHVLVPVAWWKHRVIPGFANAPKRMYTANLRQRWPHVGPRGPLAKVSKAGKKVLIEDPFANVLDAIGIGASLWDARGNFDVPEKLLKEWELL
jgi:hypothetical protein